MQTAPRSFLVDSAELAKAQTIARQNDAFRTVLTNVRTEGVIISGRVGTTRSIHMLPREDLLKVVRAVRTDTPAPDGDNPYGENDFGAVTVDLNDGEAKVFWKIDYYSDARCEYGSDDPSNPALTFRYMTIMFAHEY